MAKRKSLAELKKDLIALKSEIKIREDDLKYSIGAAILSQYEVTSVSDFITNYKIIKVEPHMEEKQNVKLSAKKE